MPCIVLPETSKAEIREKTEVPLVSSSDGRCESGIFKGLSGLSSCTARNGVYTSSHALKSCNCIAFQTFMSLSLGLIARRVSFRNVCRNSSKMATLCLCSIRLTLSYICFKSMCLRCCFSQQYTTPPLRSSYRRSIRSWVDPSKCNSSANPRQPPAPTPHKRESYAHACVVYPDNVLPWS